MKIHFEFEIDRHATADVEPIDFIDCKNLDELKRDLLDYVEPSWRVDMREDDLAMLWAEVQRLQDAEGQ